MRNAYLALIFLACMLSNVVLKKMTFLGFYVISFYYFISLVNLILFVFFSATVSAFNCLVVLPPLLIVLAFCHALANKLID